MRRVTTTHGTPIELDGDVLAVIEAIYLDLTRYKGLDFPYEDVDNEFQFLVAHFTEDELRSYLKESLFMSFNRFENERLLEIVNKAKRASDENGPREGG